MNRLRNFGLAALLGVAGALVTSNYVCSNQNLIESTNHSGSSKNTSDSGKIETIPSYTVKNNFDSGIEKDVSEDSFLPNIKINPDRLRDFPKVEEETYVGVDGFNYRTPDYWTWKSIADNE